MMTYRRDSRHCLPRTSRADSVGLETVRCGKDSGWRHSEALPLIRFVLHMSGDTGLKRLTLFTKSGCTTCNKARQFLMAAGVHYAERDIFKHPLTEAELRKLAGKRPLAELFSYRSPSAKALGLLDKVLTESEMLAHMIAEPRLIRRPLLVREDAIVVGYDEAQLRALLQLQEA